MTLDEQTMRDNLIARGERVRDRLRDRQVQEIAAVKDGVCPAHADLVNGLNQVASLTNDNCKASELLIEYQLMMLAQQDSNGNKPVPPAPPPSAAPADEACIRVFGQKLILRGPRAMLFLRDVPRAIAVVLLALVMLLLVLLLYYQKTGNDLLRRVSREVREVERAQTGP